jgi:uncharacterized protein YndB with AHSA1/START domain
MATRRHVLEEQFAVTPERMFEILITPSAIRSWWGASKAIVLPEVGGTWVASWGENVNDPDYISSFKIVEYEPPHKLMLGDGKYFSRDGQPPFIMDKMTTEFVVESRGDGLCSLRITQDGFPSEKVADDFYEACVIGWNNTFEGIRKYFFDNPDEK